VERPAAVARALGMSAPRPRLETILTLGRSLMPFGRRAEHARFR
jgi:hypothetical protein